MDDVGPRQRVASETVHCPVCNRSAVKWTTETKYGIECPHCRHTEAFRR